MIEILFQLLSELPVFSKTRGVIKANTGLLSIVLDAKESFWNGRQVDTISLLVNCSRMDGFGEHVIVVQFLSGEVRVLDLFAEYTETIKQYLIILGGQHRPLFAEYGTKADRLWKEKGVSATYTKIIKDFYENLHESMADLVVKAMQSSAALSQVVLTDGVDVISLGCGQGEDLYSCHSALLGAGLRSHCHGIDLYKREIIEAKKTLKKKVRTGFNKESFSFIEHDFTDIVSLMPKLTLNPRSVKVVISSGTLTREIMNGAYVVTKVLQDLYAHISPDVIVIGGYTHVILSPEIAKDIGYIVQTTQLDTGRLLFMLTKSSITQQKTHIENKSLRRNRDGSSDIVTLDLSICANPVALAHEFACDEEKRRLISTIDLSWSYMSGEQLSEMMLCLQQFPRLKKIIIAQVEPWSNALLKEIKANNNYSLIKRKDCSDPDELPTLSIHVARALGIYEGLPYSVLHNCSPSIVEVSATLFSEEKSSSALESAGKSAVVEDRVTSISDSTVSGATP